MFAIPSPTNVPATSRPSVRFCMLNGVVLTHAMMNNTSEATAIKKPITKSTDEISQFIFFWFCFAARKARLLFLFLTLSKKKEDQLLKMCKKKFEIEPRCCHTCKKDIKRGISIFFCTSNPNEYYIFLC